MSRYPKSQESQLTLAARMSGYMVGTPTLHRSLTSYCPSYCPNSVHITADGKNKPQRWCQAAHCQTGTQQLYHHTTQTNRSYLTDIQKEWSRTMASQDQVFIANKSLIANENVSQRSLTRRLLDSKDTPPGGVGELLRGEGRGENRARAQHEGRLRSLFMRVWAASIRCDFSDALTAEQRIVTSLCFLRCQRDPRKVE